VDLHEKHMELCGSPSQVDVQLRICILGTLTAADLREKQMFRNFPLRINKALGIFRKRGTTTITTVVALRDPSGSKKDIQVLFPVR